MTEVMIAKEIEFDAGHRVPNHKSGCRNPHGHRYTVEACCKGTIIEDPGASDEGMLVDFSYVKELLVTKVHDVLDHGFIVYEHDTVLLRQLMNIFIPESDGFGKYDVNPSGWKVVQFPYIPTAENIARWVYEELQPDIDGHFRENLTLEYIQVNETPTSCAMYPADPSES